MVLSTKNNSIWYPHIYRKISGELKSRNSDYDVFAKLGITLFEGILHVSCVLEHMNKYTLRMCGTVTDLVFCGDPQSVFVNLTKRGYRKTLG